MIDPGELISAIEIAFDGVTIDGDSTTLTQADEEGVVPYESIPRDTEAEWHSVSRDKIGRQYNGLYFLDASGFRFYLPAFMREVVMSECTQHKTCFSDAVFESLTFILSDVELADKEQHALLTEAQKKVIAMFLEWAATVWGDDPCTEAIRYWTGTGRDDQ